MLVCASIAIFWRGMEIKFTSIKLCKETDNVVDTRN